MVKIAAMTINTALFTVSAGYWTDQAITILTTPSFVEATGSMQISRGV